MKKLLHILSVVFFANQASADGTFKVGDVFICEPTFHYSTYRTCVHKGTSTGTWCFDNDTGERATNVEKITKLESREPLETFGFKLIEKKEFDDLRTMLEFNRSKHFPKGKVLVVRQIINEGESLPGLNWMSGTGFGYGSEETFSMSYDFDSVVFGYTDSSVGEMQMLNATCEKF